MRRFYFLIALLFLPLLVVPQAHSQMGGFNSLPEPQRNVLQHIVRYLGIEDSSNQAKMKINDHMGFIFSASNWNSYLNHLGEIASSRYENELNSGYVTISFNTSDKGIFFLTFIHKPETEQVFLDIQQMRYGTRTALLELYNEGKNSDEFRTIHDTDTHALLQKDGYVSYQYFNIFNDHGAVVYRDFKIIGL